MISAIEQATVKSQDMSQVNLIKLSVVDGGDCHVYSRVKDPKSPIG